VQALCRGVNQSTPVRFEPRLWDADGAGLPPARLLARLQNGSTRLRLRFQTSGPRRGEGREGLITAGIHPQRQTSPSELIRDFKFSLRLCVSAVHSLFRSWTANAWRQVRRGFETTELLAVPILRSFAGKKFQTPIREPAHEADIFLFGGGLEVFEFDKLLEFCDGRPIDVHRGPMSPNQMNPQSPTPRQRLRTHIVQADPPMNIQNLKSKLTGIGLALLAILGCHHATGAEPRKLIIDCDPGIDDAVAMVLAMQYPGFEILGITTTFGNATIEQATKNALRIVELSGKNIPVCRGADKPLTVPLRPPPDFVHGKDGLGNTHQPEPSTKPHDKPAAQFLADMAKAYPGQITILAVGRLSNLAAAIKLDSHFARNVREVVLMGGTLYVPGNVSPVAEANVGGDPHAADLVFTTPWKLTMIGLDVTTKVRLDEGMLSRVKARNERFGPFLYSITRFYDEFHRNVEHVSGGVYVHDPSAVVYLMEPDIFELKEGPVRVVCEGIAIGQTIMAAYDYQFHLPPWKDKPKLRAAVGVDRARFEKALESGLLGDQR
jgi:inosine-uridine nucleoside N-ribohydrolase